MSTVLETRRLLCRRWKPSDFDALYALYSDPIVVRWVGDGTPITRPECEQWFEVTAANYARRGYGMFALEEKASGSVVGFAGLVHPGGQQDAEIKYAFSRSCWGQGLAGEIVPALLRYGAQAHALRRIVATVAPENVASQRVLLKAGATLVQRRTNDDGSATLVFEWLAPDAR